MIEILDEIDEEKESRIRYLENKLELLEIKCEENLKKIDNHILYINNLTNSIRKYERLLDDLCGLFNSKYSNENAKYNCTLEQFFDTVNVYDTYSVINSRFRTIETELNMLKANLTEDGTKL